MDKAWKSSEDLFELCLAAMKQEGRSLEECLARYPEQRSELEPLLRTAVRLEKAPSIQASTQFKSEALQRLKAADITKPKPQKRWWAFLIPAFNVRKGALIFGNHQPRVAFLIAGLILVVMIAVGAGTVIASAQALPGDFLYPVKRSHEDLQLNLTMNVVDQAELHLAFADRRMIEAVALLKQERTSFLKQTLADYDRHMQTELAFISTGSSLTPGQKSDLADKLLNEVNRYETSLSAMIPETPASAKNNLESALATSRKTYDQAVDVLNNQNGNTLPTPFLTPTPSLTTFPAAKPTPTRIPDRSSPTVTVTASRQPSTDNFPSATSTKPANIRMTTAPPTIKVPPTATVTRTPSINSSRATATRPSVDNVIKPTATQRTVPDQLNFSATVTKQTR